MHKCVDSVENMRLLYLKPLPIHVNRLILWWINCICESVNQASTSVHSLTRCLCFTHIQSLNFDSIFWSVFPLSGESMLSISWRADSNSVACSSLKVSS